MRSACGRRFLNRLFYRLQTKRLGSLFLLLLFSAGCLYSLSLYQTVFRPALCALGEASAARLSQEIIHSAVNEVLMQDSFYGAKLISIERSDDGQIAAVVPDIAAMNRLKSELALLIQKKLAATNDTTISIPLGNLTGIELFSNLGPGIHIQLIPYGKAFVDFESHFSDAGINQTKHQLLASINTEISMLLPDRSYCGTKVHTAIPLCETIVVGSVPNSYTNLETERENMKDDLLNLIE